MRSNYPVMFRMNEDKGKEIISYFMDSMVKFYNPSHNDFSHYVIGMKNKFDEKKGYENNFDEHVVIGLNPCETYQVYELKFCIAEINFCMEYAKDDLKYIFANHFNLEQEFSKYRYMLINDVEYLDEVEPYKVRYDIENIYRFLEKVLGVKKWDEVKEKVTEKIKYGQKDL